MNKRVLKWQVAFAALFSVLVLSPASNVFAQTEFTFEGNPLVRHIFTADPTARVFNGRLYVYTSHDNERAEYFDMTDWRVFSTDDMVNWKDHGAFFGLDDIPWAETMAWAPDCVERNGKYYFYYPVERKKIGVAVSDNPISGFVDSGKPIVDNTDNKEKVGREPIDPTVIVDNGQAYMYFGCRDFRMVKLAENMIDTIGDIKKPIICGNENDKENFGGYYGEGPFIFKKNDLFYLLYSNGWKTTSTLVYAISKSPEGPFDYVGEVMAPVGTRTSHGSIVEFKGKWYVFYHSNYMSGKTYRRSVCFDEITFDEKGMIQRIEPTRSKDMSDIINGQNGDGKFLNPVLGGDYPDPTIMREGNDYYMTHSAFDYVPGLTVFHSVDLINWKPISSALTTYLGHGWAPDICKYGDKYYIYFTVYPKGNFVVYANSPNGPWSTPVDLKIKEIDPCHVVDENGQRWLFLSGGNRIKLSEDGLSVVQDKFEKVYSGWQFPKDWVVEGFYLEGPKIKKIGEYYYYISAQGGTAGPPTSHMAVVARSKSIDGPWENAPNNPLIHTYSADEKWWSKGHGSLIDLPDGSLWMFYHAYEKNYHGLGRQTMLEPVFKTDDDWLKAPTGAAVDKPINIPLKQGISYNRHEKINEFRIGLDWKYYKKYDPSRASFKDGVLTIKAQSSTIHESAPLLFVAGVQDYEFSVKIECETNAAAGLVLFYNDKAYMATGSDNGNICNWENGEVKGLNIQQKQKHIWIKIQNKKQNVTSWYSIDGEKWIKASEPKDVADFNHNKLRDFQSLLPGIFAYGDGEVRFSDFVFIINE
jgi:beta-xylosidase